MSQQGDDEMFSPEALGEYLKVPLQSVYGWNSKGTGPRRVKIGRHIRYRKRDVETWLEAHAATGNASLGEAS